jgi:hypothetical protein
MRLQKGSYIVASIRHSMIESQTRVRTLLLALAIVLVTLVAGTTAVRAQSNGELSSVEGRVTQLTINSIGVLVAQNGRVVHFHLEPYFEDFFAANERTQIDRDRFRIGSLARIYFDPRFTTRRAVRVVLLHQPR